MFLDYYKLQEKPFEITTDPRFLWLGEKHQEALATLRYGVHDDKGFLLLSGDVGTGKTTLINALVEGLGEDTVVARLIDPNLTLIDFYQIVSDAFQLGKLPQSKAEFYRLFRPFLEKLAHENKRALLIIDEAQRFESLLLEEIRLLSNIELATAKLLNIFFVGQNEINDILLRPENSAIRQRITVHYALERLSLEDIEQYINHRLRVAGGTEELFTAKAVKEIYAFSRGTPRLINIISDRALLTGFVEEKRIIDANIIQECARELNILPFKKNTPAEPAKISLPGHNPQQQGPIKYAFTAHPEPQPRKSGCLLFLAAAALLVVGFVAAIFLFAPDVFDRYRDTAKDTLEKNRHLFEQRETTSLPHQNIATEKAGPSPPPPQKKETANKSVSKAFSNPAPMQEIAPEGRRQQSVQQNNREAAIIIEFTLNHGIIPQEAQKILAEQVCPLLNATSSRNMRFEIGGHSDTRGDFDANIQLSKIRAEKVKNYLVKTCQVSAERLQVVYFGPTMPLVPNTSPENMQRNRRVEIRPLQ